MKFYITIFFAFLFLNNSNAQSVSFSFLFDSGKFVVAPFEARDFFKLIKNIKTDSITIKGHTDTIGSDFKNQILSVKRVNAVKQLLLQNGIKAKQIKIAKGFGETIQLNDSIDYLLKNRRVEVYVNEYKKIEIPKPIEKVKIAKPKKKIIENRTAPLVQLDTNIAKPISIQYAKFIKGEKIVLPNLNFYGNKHILTPEGESSLQYLILKLKEFNKVNFLIIGHICCTIPGQYDALDEDTGEPTLSENRAKEIFERLSDAGIDKKRMKYEGRGGTEKLYPFERTSIEAEKNRRVEIIIK